MDIGILYLEWSQAGQVGTPRHTRLAATSCDVIGTDNIYQAADGDGQTWQCHKSSGLHLSPPVGVEAIELDNSESEGWSGRILPM